MEVTFENCDFNNPKHREALLLMMDEYMTDPMGDAEAVLDKNQQLQLIEGLANHPSCLCVFVLYKGEFAGLSISFINFSTFKVKPYLYAHDLFVRVGFRSKGLGKQLLQRLVDISNERGYCKITLEVRNDNRVALYLYRELGFTDTDPAMYFWTKTL
jgi:ribosomal protein S18 acetylase RimI-like enzyme